MGIILKYLGMGIILKYLIKVAWMFKYLSMWLLQLCRDILYSIKCDPN